MFVLISFRLMQLKNSMALRERLSQFEDSAANSFYKSHATEPLDYSDVDQYDNNQKDRPFYLEATKEDEVPIFDSNLKGSDEEYSTSPSTVLSENVWKVLNKLTASKANKQAKTNVLRAFLADVNGYRMQSDVARKEKSEKRGIKHGLVKCIDYSGCNSFTAKSKERHKCIMSRCHRSVD